MARDSNGIRKDGPLLGIRRGRQTGKDGISTDRCLKVLGTMQHKEEGGRTVDDSNVPETCLIDP